MWPASLLLLVLSITLATGGTFKKRWYKQKDDFKKSSSKHNTKLSTHVRNLKEESKPFNIDWDIMDRAPTYDPANSKFGLCLKEIYYIIFKPESATLNQRNELFNTCRHRTQQLLKFS